MNQDKLEAAHALVNAAVGLVGPLGVLGVYVGQLENIVEEVGTDFQKQHASVALAHFDQAVKALENIYDREVN